MQHLESTVEKLPELGKILKNLLPNKYKDVKNIENLTGTQNVDKSRDFENEKLNFVEKIIPLKSPIGVIKKQERTPAIDYEVLNAELILENDQDNEMDQDPAQEENFEQFDENILQYFPSQNDQGLILNEILPK